MSSSFCTIRIVFLAAIALIICSIGCSKNSLPVISVKVKISFVDAAGVDKVKGLDLHNTNGYREINKTQYQATVSALPEHDSGLALLAVDQRKEGDFIFFNIHLGMVRGDYRLRSTEVVLTCAHIFGDDQPHKVTMHWNDQMTCTQIDYNGKSYPVTIDPDNDGNVLSTIVID